MGSRSQTLPLTAVGWRLLALMVTDPVSPSGTRVPFRAVSSAALIVTVAFATVEVTKMPRDVLDSAGTATWI